MSALKNYDLWDKGRLISRIRQLENELKLNKQKHFEDERLQHKRDAAELAEPTDTPILPKPSVPQKRRTQRQADPSRYSTRIIALKFAYFGKRYVGLEHQAGIDLPSVEGELWKALVKSCLIITPNPEVVDFDRFNYFKCGRTDRGVSAFGQVVSLRVRSNRPLLNKPEVRLEGATVESIEEERPGPEANTIAEELPSPELEPEFDEIKDEIHYCRLLNRLLPEDIRVLAWCPAPSPDFSARFSCRERQYRYFFTQPAFSPRPTRLEAQGVEHPIKEGWLDIEAMREAAQKFVGLHDFRNFCKVDGTKQIANFQRRIFEADIVEVKDIQSALPFLNDAEFALNGVAGTDTPPKVYSFNVRGSAFLWHQIRHMVSVLFLVGQKSEPPSIITKLLDVENVPRKPNYTMAHESPLVLWDCIFPKDDDPQGKDALPWVYAGDESPDVKYGRRGLIDDLWSFWREKKVDEILAHQLLNHVTLQQNAAQNPGKRLKVPKGQRIFEGDSTARLGGLHTPLLERPTSYSPAEINDHYAQRRGFRDAEDMTSNEDWRIVLREARKNKSRGIHGDQP